MRVTGWSSKGRRWLDSDHEALVFPGPDAHVVTAEEEAVRLHAC